jgi:ESS family glutamate:Na+ symporter
MILSTFQTSDFESTWQILFQFGIICVLLLIGNILRRKIKFLNKLLFPTAIIAGFLGLGIKYLFQVLNVELAGVPIIRNELFEIITYHGIALGFIALGLKSVKKNNEYKGHPYKSGLVIVSTYLIQGIVGLAITITIGFFLSVPQYSGILLPMGFGQGPGQAGNIGGTYQDAGFIGGKSFGLMIATLGTISACVGGIFFINRRKQEGKVVHLHKSTEETQAVVYEEKNEIPVSEAIDKLTIQICLVIGIYVISFLFIYFITKLINIPAINRVLWGFNFIFGMLFAMLAKIILNKLYDKKIMKRKYTNDYMLNRITGTVFDFMVISSICAIDFNSLNNPGLWITLGIMGVVGAFLTYFYLRLVVYKNYKGYEVEAFATFYGNLTGTVSEGIALLREVDPEFETPASDDLVSGSSTAVMFGAPILLITAIINNENKLFMWLSLGILIVLFVIFFYFLMYHKPKVKNNAKEVETGNISE